MFQAFFCNVSVSTFLDIGFPTTAAICVKKFELLWLWTIIISSCNHSFSYLCCKVFHKVCTQKSRRATSSHCFPWCHTGKCSWVLKSSKNSVNFKTFPSYFPSGLPSRVINNTQTGGIETHLSTEEADGTFPDAVLAGDLADVWRQTGPMVGLVTFTTFQQLRKMCHLASRAIEQCNKYTITWSI